MKFLRWRAAPLAGGVSVKRNRKVIFVFRWEQGRLYVRNTPGTCSIGLADTALQFPEIHDIGLPAACPLFTNREPPRCLRNFLLVSRFRPPPVRLGFRN